MQVALGISSIYAYTRDDKSLNALYELEISMYLPLASANVRWVKIPRLELCEPKLSGSCCIAVWSTENYLQPKVAEAGSRVFRLVIRGLQEGILIY